MPVQPLDEDSAFTYRKRQKVFPRSSLAEEIEGNILHLANRQFTARRWNEEKAQEVSAMDIDVSGTKHDVLGNNEKKPRRSRSTDMNSTSESDYSDEDQQSRTSTEAATDSEAEDRQSESENRTDGRRAPGVRVVPTADDDFSSAILRPAVGDIVTKLEKTLTVLHNMMVATAQPTGYDDESSSEDAETGPDESSHSRSRSRRPRSGSRSRSRPRRRVKRPRPPSVFSNADTTEAPPYASPQKKARHADAAAPEDPGDDGAGSDSTPNPTSREPSPDLADAPEAPHTRPGRPKRQRPVRLNRLAPRDWRTALAAASLAGFPQAAVQRAAQRCADLFGEGMELRTVHDHSPVRDTFTPVVPGGKVRGAEDDEVSGEVARMRLAARDAARRGETAAGSASRSRSRTSRARRSQTPAGSSGSRSRSRSRSATPHLTCPYRDCPRSIEAFSRRGNLMRHVELVHGGEGGAALLEVDSEDEVEAGVHVDGFLRAVRARKGWREWIEGDGERGRRGREEGKRRDRAEAGGGYRYPRPRPLEEDEGYYYSGALEEDDPFE